MLLTRLPCTDAPSTMTVALDGAGRAALYSIIPETAANRRKNNVISTQSVRSRMASGPLLLQPVDSLAKKRKQQADQQG